MSAQSGNSSGWQNNLTPFWYQQEVLNSPADKVALVAGRITGKTTTLRMAAISSALQGKKVLFSAPSQQMLSRVNNELLSDIRNNNFNTTKETKSEIELASGGVITLSSLSARGVYHNPDVFLMDEFAQFRKEKQPMIGPPMQAADKIIVAGTPPSNMKLPQIDNSWDIKIVATKQNPSLSSADIEEYRRSLRNNKTELCEWLSFGDHHLFPVKTGINTIYRCLFCEFSGHTPPESTGEHHKYVIGEAIETPCR